MKRVLFFVLYIISVFPMEAQNGRVALIIGNSEYTGRFSRLHTSGNDADAMNNMLQKLGFTTIVKKDAKREDMTNILNDFKKRAYGAEIALFYYSGHGGMIGGDKYYLVPSGHIESSSTLSNDCYGFESVEKTMKDISAPIKMIFIDACRNSLENSLKGPMPIGPDRVSSTWSGGMGMIYYYGTGENKEAKTGSGNLSLFTQSLVNHIGEPYPFNVVWNHVVIEVSNKDTEQRPFCNDKNDISSRIFLNPMKKNIFPELVSKGYDVVSFNTHPQNTTIFINGKTYKDGESITLKYGEPYSYRVTCQGYDNYENTVTLSPTQNPVIDVNLIKHEPATIFFTSSIENVNIYVDDTYIGKAPMMYKTHSGKHTIKCKRNYYYDYSTTLSTLPGSQTLNIEMNSEGRGLFELKDDVLGILSYHYSPKYQIGLSFMYRLEDSHFSFGGIIASSTGLYRGWNLNNSSNVSVSQSTSIDLTTGSSGTSGTIKSSTETLRGEDEDYSNIVDPYNEAKHYDSNALILASAGYNPFNLIMLEAGIGAAYHRDKYYMDNTYNIITTTETDVVTNEVINTSESYKETGNSHWYKQNTKWSTAFRIGAKLFIPLDHFDKYSITIGMGYTYLPSLNKFSSWDANVGFGWFF